MDRLKFEEYIEDQGRLTYRNKGVSMMPMLKQGRDSFTVERKVARAAKWDVVLFRRDGKYVLHRVIAVHPDSYTILGDNCITAEEHVPEADVLAVLTEFTHRGHICQSSNFLYRCYVTLWCKPYHLRIAVKKLVMKLKRLVKKILGIQ